MWEKNLHEAESRWPKIDQKCRKITSINCKLNFKMWFIRVKLSQLFLYSFNRLYYYIFSKWFDIDKKYTCERDKKIRSNISLCGTICEKKLFDINYVC